MGWVFGGLNAIFAALFLQVGMLKLSFLFDVISRCCQRGGTNAIYAALFMHVGNDTTRVGGIMNMGRQGISLPFHPPSVIRRISRLPHSARI